MKVKTISRTMSFGNYENISMSADVEDGETVGEAIGKLEAVINEEIKKRNNYHLEKSCVDNLEYRKSQLKEGIEHLENRYNKMKAFLEMHGVRICEITELPF